MGWGRGHCCSGWSCLLRKSDITGSNPALPSKFQRNTISSWLAKNQYCGEPPWPRGSVLGLWPPGLEFRVPFLEDSVTSFILRMFSCPGLAYKGGLKPYSFNYDTIHLSWAFNLVFWSWGEIMFYVSQLASPADGPMLVQCWLNVGQRRRRWTNIEPTLPRLLSAGISQFYFYGCGKNINLFYSKIRINICL